MKEHSEQRVVEFLKEIRAVCRKHKLKLWATDNYTMAVDTLLVGEEPIPDEDLEDYTQGAVSKK